MFIPACLEEFKTHLRGHILNTSGNKPSYLQCYCGSIQNSFKTLKAHVIKQHPGEPEGAFSSICDVPPVYAPMDVHQDDGTNDSVSGTRFTKEELKETAAKAVSKLRSDLALTEVKVKFFMDFYNELI